MGNGVSVEWFLPLVLFTLKDRQWSSIWQLNQLVGVLIPKPLSLVQYKVQTYMIRYLADSNVLPRYYNWIISTYMTRRYHCLWIYDVWKYTAALVSPGHRMLLQCWAEPEVLGFYKGETWQENNRTNIPKIIRDSISTSSNPLEWFCVRVGTRS